MKQIVITQAGGVEVFRLQAGNEPKAGQGQVVIQVKAAGINFADILARKGLYLDAPPFPCVVGYEVAGVVTETGKDVDPSWKGKEVLTLTRFGGYSSAVTVPVANIIEKPEKLSFEEAAAIPVTYLTAYVLLVTMGSLRQGEHVLIHNAGGGVGLAALDIALRIGAVPIGTASTHKHQFLKERGYSHVIDYRKEDWRRAVMKITQNQGVELIIDPLGGSHWKKSFSALRKTGRLGMFGVSTVTDSSLKGKLRFLSIAVKMPWFNPVSLMNSNRGVFGVNLGHIWDQGSKVKEWFEDIIRGVEEGWIRPYVDRIFIFDEVGKAHTYIEERKNIGKVILIPG